MFPVARNINLKDDIKSLLSEMEYNGKSYFYLQHTTRRISPKKGKWFLNMYDRTFLTNNIEIVLLT